MAVIRNGELQKVKYIVKLAYDGDGNLEYVGKASPYAATSDAVWQIRKLSYTANVLQDVLYADGGNYSQIWDNRTGLSYA